MSVNFASGIARGWKMNSKQISDFNKTTNYKYEDDFIYLDSTDGESDAIFGCWLSRISDIGEAKIITDVLKNSTMNDLDWIKKLEEGNIQLQDCGSPTEFLIFQVN